MNRYARGGPSKATSTTTCQKCLKKDSYECKAIVQERPYVGRPSRTQQMKNPSLLPKLTSDAPQDLLRKKGVADEQLARLELERGRKRERQSEDPDVPEASKRMRSDSFDSVSSISTRSSPPQANRNARSGRPGSTSFSQSPVRKGSFRTDRQPLHSRSPAPRPRTADVERKRRRNSESSVESYTSDEARNGSRNRSTRRRFNQTSPRARGRRSESRSPRRQRRQLSNDRQKAYDRRQDRHSSGDQHSRLQENRPPVKERSLSPFSKRLALTQSMNMAR